MFPIQQEKLKSRAIDEKRKCLIGPCENEREIVACFKNELCRFCAHLLFETFCDPCASARQMRDNRD